MNCNWKCLILSSLLAILLAFVPPIENGRLKVSGKVKNSTGQKLEGVRIILMDSLGRSVIDTISTNSRGAYNIDLAYQSKYRLYFEKEGYYKIYFSFDTELPYKKELLDYYYSPPSEIMLSDSFELNEKAFRKSPITEISFYDYYDQFRQNDELLSAYLDALQKPNVGALVVQGNLKGEADSLVSKVKVFAVSKSGEILDSSYTAEDGSYEIETPLQEEEVKISFESPKIHNTFFTVNSQVDSTATESEYFYQNETEVFAALDSNLNTRAFKRPTLKIAYNAEKTGFEGIVPVNDRFVEKLNTPIYDSMKVIGRLFAENDKNIGGTLIKVIENDSTVLFTKLVPAGDSIFDLNIPINKTLNIVYESPGFHESFIQVDSRVNDEKLNVLNTNVTLFDTLNELHNPQAFNRPTEKFFYNDASSQFESDETVAAVFKRTLGEEPSAREATGSVLLTGVTRNSQGKKLGDVELIFMEDGLEVFRDTSDNKGRYEAKLKLNKSYRMYSSKEGFYKHFMDINTKVPKAQYDDKYALSPPIILFSEDLPEITNPIGFEQLPFEVLNYSQTEDQFQISQSAFDDLRDVVTRAPFEQLAEQDTSEGLDEIPVYTVENTFLTVKGKIRDMNDKRLKDVQVFLMEENDIIQITASDNAGQYELDAPYDRELEVKFMDDDYFEAYFQLFTDADSSYKNRELELQDMVLYARANDNINPLAFDKPRDRFVFDPIADALEPDVKVRYEFNRMLETPLEKPLLTLSGRVKKNSGGYMNNVKVYLRNDTAIVDSTLTNRKGEYQINIPYNSKYQLSFAEEKHHETYIDVDTRTALEEQDLRKEEHTAETVEMFKLKDDKLENNAFANAYSEVNFNPVTGGFRNRPGVRENFMASVFKPVVEEEEVLADAELSFEEIEAEEIEAEEKGIDQLLERYKERAEQHKLAQTRNEIKDSRYRLASSMLIGDSTDYSKIENVLLKNRNINNVIFETFLPNLDRQKSNRQVADVSEGAKRLNDIARSVSLSLRKGALLDSISIDSIFQVNRDVRIYESEYGSNIHEVKRFIVKHDGRKDEYGIITNWFFFDSFIKNNEEIDEEEFYAEFNRFLEESKM